MSATAQCTEALKAANRTRLSRVRLRRRIAADSHEAAVARVGRVMAHPEPEWEGMTVFRLVSAIRRYGHARTLKALHAAGISENCTVDALTERQQAALKVALR